MNRTDRLIAIILLLRARKKITAQQLAEIFEVSTRTIYRDVDSLCMAGVPVAAEWGPEGGYSLMDTHSLPPVMFSLDEAVALFLGGSFIAHFQGTPFQDAIKTALAKLDTILPDELRESVGLSADSILLDVMGQDEPPISEDVFATINRAILERKCVQIVYNNVNKEERTRRIVAPYGLIYDNGNGIWYLIGHCHLRGEQRMFRLPRIEEISLTEQDFELPDAFDLKHLAGRGWAASLAETLKREHPRIRIKVTRERSERLRHDWLLRYAEREETPDGKIILTFHRDSLPPGLSFPCHFGIDCEILEPPELRKPMMIFHFEKVLPAVLLVM